MNTYEDLTDMQMDALREIGNIGSGNAASALSSMLGRPINIDVPSIKLLDYETVVQKLGGPEQILVGLLLSMTDDVTGMIMFLLHNDFAHMVINTLMGTELQPGVELDEMGESAVREVGNIMAASYINAMVEMTGLSVNISIPDFCMDMAGSILSVPAIYYANLSDKILFIENSFISEEENAASHVLLIPEIDSLDKIMCSLGMDV